VKTTGEKFYIPDLKFLVDKDMALARISANEPIATQIYNLPNGMYVKVTVELGSQPLKDFQELLTQTNTFECYRWAFVSYFGKEVSAVTMRGQPAVGGGLINIGGGCQC